MFSEFSFIFGKLAIFSTSILSTFFIELLFGNEQLSHNNCVQWRHLFHDSIHYISKQTPKSIDKTWNSMKHSIFVELALLKLRHFVLQTSARNIYNLCHTQSGQLFSFDCETERVCMKLYTVLREWALIFWTTGSIGPLGSVHKKIMLLFASLKLYYS